MEHYATKAEAERALQHKRVERTIPHREEEEEEPERGWTIEMTEDGDLYLAPHWSPRQILHNPVLLAARLAPAAIFGVVFGGVLSLATQMPFWQAFLLVGTGVAALIWLVETTG